MTLRDESGEQAHELGAGDAILIPRGVAHGAVLHTPEVQILFLSTYEGSKAWMDGGSGAAQGLTLNAAAAARG